MADNPFQSPLADVSPRRPGQPLWQIALHALVELAAGVLAGRYQEIPVRGLTAWVFIGTWFAVFPLYFHWLIKRGDHIRNVVGGILLVVACQAIAHQAAVYFLLRLTAFYLLPMPVLFGFAYLVIFTVRWTDHNFPRK